MDAWVARARAAGGTCPHCGSTDVRPVVHGLPDAATYRRLQGQVVFAGCCVPDDPPGSACGTCAGTWGQERPPAGPPDDEPVRDEADLLRRLGVGSADGLADWLYAVWEHDGEVVCRPSGVELLLGRHGRAVTYPFALGELREAAELLVQDLEEEGDG